MYGDKIRGCRKSFCSDLHLQTLCCYTCRLVVDKPETIRPDGKFNKTKLVQVIKTDVTEPSEVSRITLNPPTGITVTNNSSTQQPGSPTTWRVTAVMSYPGKPNRGHISTGGIGKL